MNFENEALFMLLQVIRGRVGMILNRTEIAELRADTDSELRKLNDLGLKIEKMLYSDNELEKTPTYEKDMRYCVSYTCDIVSGESGEVIDYHTEDEYYSEYSDAQARADELRSQIGDEICSWGDDVGVLREVDLSDTPEEIVCISV